METTLILRFLIGSLFVVVGLTIFLLGVDIGITPLGSLTGSSLAKTNKLWIVREEYVSLLTDFNDLDIKN